MSHGALPLAGATAACGVSRRGWLGLGLMVAAVAPCGLTATLPTSPNVVHFFVDDMGWTDWQRSTQSPKGSVVNETPNLVAFAQSGSVFNSGYASASVCSASRVSLLTGLSAPTHRTTDYLGGGTTTLRGVCSPTGLAQGHHAPDVTLVESLLADGYRTGQFGMCHLGNAGTAVVDPLQYGDQVNVGGTSLGKPGPAGGFFAGADGAWAGLPGLSTPGTFPSSEYLSDAISTRAADFVGQRVAAGGPFFVSMAEYLPHTQIEAPAALVTNYQHKIAALNAAGTNLGGHTNATYAAMLEKMDESVGRVMNLLRKPKGDGSQADSVLNSTMVVFTSDNGGLTSPVVTSNQPLRKGKGSAYEGGILEPWIVSWAGSPQVQSGVVNSTPVVTHDLYPTLLELTGVAGNAAHNSRVEGVGFAGALAGQTLDSKPIVWHYPHVSPQDGGANNNGVEGRQFVSAIRDVDWKLIWFYETARYELYNLSTDRIESHNILNANPATALDLSIKLRNELSTSPSQMSELNLTNGSRALELPPGAQLEAPIPFDTFSGVHDYRAAATAGTAWDGLSNGAAATAVATAGGSLRLESLGTSLVPASFNAPVLYKEVTGDFDARMDSGSMTCENFHVLALIAMESTSEIIWVGQQDRTGTGDFALSRSNDGAAQVDQTLTGVYGHYRLVREGTKFRGYVSQDGLFWRQFSAYDRPDLPATLRVGVTQASFSRAPMLAELDSFTLRQYLELLGDFNDDSVVDAADYAVWRDGLGTTYTQFDNKVWKLHLGATAASSAAGANAAPTRTVPGPGCVLLFTSWAVLSLTTLS